MNVATAMRLAADARLRAAAGVVAAFGPAPVRLYPLAAPTNGLHPYGVYRVEVVGDDTECAEGSEVYLILDIFAREETYVESVMKAEAIAGATRACLSATFDLDGHVVDDWTFEGDRPVADPDVLTEHRHVRFRYLTTVR